MSTTRNAVDDPRNRFFHAMVLMGGSLALGCGGATTHDPGASGGASAGGAPGSGGAPASGGTPASGGVNGTGGSTIISLGGAATVGPFDCPPAQWDCKASPPQCYGQQYMLPASCACDTTRPLVASDCSPGTDFVCRVAGVDSQQRSIPSLPFECACVPQQTNCQLACDKVFDDAGRCSMPNGPDSNSILCDCAWIVLR